MTQVNLSIIISPLSHLLFIRIKIEHTKDSQGINKLKKLILLIKEL